MGDQVRPCASQAIWNQKTVWVCLERKRAQLMTPNDFTRCPKRMPWSVVSKAVLAWKRAWRVQTFTFAWGCYVWLMPMPVLFPFSFQNWPCWHCCFAIKNCQNTWVTWDSNLTFWSHIANLVYIISGQYVTGGLLLPNTSHSSQPALLS